MNKKRLGFLTPSGTITAALTVLVVAGVGLFSGGVLFNPGPLNAKTGPMQGGVRSHAQLTTQCGSCHAPFWSQASMADRCQSCHTDIPAQMGNLAALHGNLSQNNASMNCRDCHPEHRGANAALTDMTNVKVDHAAFGYSLAAHKTNTNGQPFACADCHPNGYVQIDLSTCITCHQQIQADFMEPHIQAYGNECLACHDGVETYGHAFDHSLLSFPLIGKHSQVACASCHTGEHSLAAMKATSTDCYSCHSKDDVHQGALGTGCAACHSPAGWTPPTFDHNTVAFKLTGKHQQVSCTDCHPANVFKGTPTDCVACHAKDDVHQGDLGQLCDQCHNTSSWADATFDHNLAIFKLVGKHALVPCGNCHINNMFKGTPTACNACHARDDIHQGALGAACEACHTPAAWVPSTFNHASAAFKLTGAHASAACTACHKDRMFKNTPTDCYSCHAGNDAHKGAFGTGCGMCHSTTAWLPSTFNHNSVFALTGAHASLSCNSCHANGQFNISASCSSCHADPPYHQGLFSGTSCGSCHSTTSWTPASYSGSHPGGCDGNCISHRDASCRDCHPNNLMSATCLKCHDSNNPGDGGGGGGD